MPFIPDDNSINQSDATKNFVPDSGATKGFVPDEDTFNQSQVGLAHSQNLLDSLVGGVGTVFPGQKVGEAIGTLGGYGYTKAKDILQGTNVAEDYSVNAPSPIEVLGDVAKGTALIGGLKMPLPAAKTIGGAAIKTGLQTGALGALAGGGEAAANKLAWKNIAKSAFYSGITGATAGTLIGGVVKGIEKITSPERIYNNALKVTQRIKSAGKSPSQFLADEGIWGNLGTFKKAADEGIATEAQQIATAIENTPGGTNWTDIKAAAQEKLLKRFSEIYSPKEIGKMVDNVPLASLQNTKKEIPWKTVNTARMQLGQLIGDTKWLQINPTESTRATKAVYGALSDAVKEATDTTENFARESKWIQTNKIVRRAMDIADSKYGLGLYDLIGGGAGAITGALTGEDGIGQRIKNAVIGGTAGLAIERGLGSPALKTGVAQLAKKLPVEAGARVSRTAMNALLSKLFGASDTGATQ